MTQSGPTRSARYGWVKLRVRQNTRANTSIARSTVIADPMPPPRAGSRARRAFDALFAFGRSGLLLPAVVDRHRRDPLAVDFHGRREDLVVLALDLEHF